jgi:hypothetical protein
MVEAVERLPDLHQAQEGLGVMFDNASRTGTGKPRKARNAWGNYRPRDRDPGAALDAALAAFMGPIEDQG